MTVKLIRLLKNKNSGQIYKQTSIKKTLFHRFTEKDYISIGILLYYHFDVENIVNAMDINVVDENALDIFTPKAKSYIKTAAGENKIKLGYFGEPPVQDVSKKNYIKKIDKWKDLNKLGNFRRNTGQLSENLLYLNHVKKNIIDIENFFQELSSEFDLFENDILYKNLKGFQNWRNRIISDTVNNFEFRIINKNFLAFILLHLFILCQDEFNIMELEYLEVDGGKSLFSKLHNIIDSKIKQIKNELKKKKSRSKTKSRGKKLKRKSRKY